MRAKYELKGAKPANLVRVSVENQCFIIALNTRNHATLVAHHQLPV
jgi:hypothetical protein